MVTVWESERKPCASEFAELYGTIYQLIALKYKYKYKWEFVERGLQIVQGR